MFFFKSWHMSLPCVSGTNSADRSSPFPFNARQLTLFCRARDVAHGKDLCCVPGKKTHSKDLCRPVFCRVFFAHGDIFAVFREAFAVYSGHTAKSNSPVVPGTCCSFSFVFHVDMINVSMFQNQHLRG